MKCCGNCFGDFFLAKIISDLSSENGTCAYCGSKSVAVTSTDSLFLTFDGLRDALYKESQGENSLPLSKLLRSDWDLFKALDDSTAEELLDTIIPGYNSVCFEPVVAHDSEAVLEWDEFRDELQHENRFFPQKKTFDAQHEGRLFEYLTASEAASKKLYRARLLMREEPYELNEMGKPPPDLVSYGRANPMGISYLYVATTDDTAVAEIRPYKDAQVCVASYELTESLNFADLCDPRSRISPFLLVVADDDEGLRLLRRYMPFLERMGEELSKPVSPHNSHLEYLPSQYLCEFLKKEGFHGVVYNSSVGSGLNYAIFDDASLQGIDVKTCRVDEVKLITSSLT